MKWLVALVLSLVMAGGWCAEAERFQDTEVGSKLVLLLDVDSVVVAPLGADGKAYLASTAVVDEKGEPTGAGWFGVRKKDCAAGMGASPIFADKDMSQVMGVVQWGHDPDNVFTKVAKRVCQLGRAKAGI